jgi:putative transposase
MIAPANTPDCKLIEGIVESVVVDRPPPEDGDQHLCLDKGFDTKDAEAVVVKAGYEPHIRRIGEEATACDRAAGHKPRRWVVERTIGWLNKCRALLVRYDKKGENYLGLTQFACALLWWRKLCKLCNEPVSG